MLEIIIGGTVATIVIVSISFAITKHFKEDLMSFLGIAMAIFAIAAISCLTGAVIMMAVAECNPQGKSTNEEDIASCCTTAADLYYSIDILS